MLAVAADATQFDVALLLLFDVDADDDDDEETVGLLLLAATATDAVVVVDAVSLGQASFLAELMFSFILNSA